MGNVVRGTVIKQLGGFYYVKSADDTVFECRARGRFRLDRVSPMVGDSVEIETDGETLGFVMSIDTRKNFLIRPPVANIDSLVLVVSFVEPLPNTVVMDKLIALSEMQGIPITIVFTKSSMGVDSSLVKIYRDVGYNVFVVDSVSGEGLAELRGFLEHSKLYTFTGNSGAGKSTLLNALFGKLSLPTGEISKKLGRGRHTTRHSELFSVNGLYVVDTPGFSALEIAKLSDITAPELQDYFTEIAELSSKCKFTGCSHVAEAGCAVRQGLESGKIAKTRYDSYCSIYSQLKGNSSW